jgi:hypothetical protein
LFCPEVIHFSRRQNPKYRAEVEFFDALAWQMPEGWHVFYHVGWLNRDGRGALRDGESDFVLAHATHGVLVVELKGGFISFEGRRQQWVSTDRQGVDHDIKNPFGQAKDSKHTLIDKLREQPDLAGKWVGLHHAVAFPDCPRRDDWVHPEADPHLIIWQEDVQRLPTRLVEILRHSYGGDTFRHGREVLATLHRLLCRTVALANPLRTQIDAEAREIQALTDSQIDICTALLPHYRGQVGIRPRMSVGRAVEYHPYAEGALGPVLGRVLARLLVTERLLAKDIVMLTPRDPAESALPVLPLPSGIRLTADETAVRGRTVLWANVADFKGLERPVALVAELDDCLPSDPRERDAVLYVAFSRPRSLLAVFHTDATQGWVPGVR